MEGFLRPKECFGPFGKAGISESSSRRDPDFPEPVVLSRYKNGRVARKAYLASEIEAWIRRRVAADRGAA